MVEQEPKANQMNVESVPIIIFASYRQVNFKCTARVGNVHAFEIVPFRESVLETI